jgi:hypothetical protein
VTNPERHATGDESAGAFYRSVMRALRHDGVPFLVGGTYALERHAGISRGTKDLDLFVTWEHWPAVMRAMESAGIQTELTFSHWLGKAYRQTRTVDFVFAGGNGLARVDAEWFAHGVEAVVFDEAVHLCPAEEAIWSKAFIMERERFDGADVLHLLRAGARSLDWVRLVRRFGQHWRVLLAHLILFGFVYPGERDAVPAWVLRTLVTRLANQPPAADEPPTCAGTLLSRAQYLVDVTAWGYADARLRPGGTMTAEQVEIWTDAAHREMAAHGGCGTEFAGQDGNGGPREVR